jgi:hypothetical protein
LPIVLDPAVVVVEGGNPVPCLRLVPLEWTLGGVPEQFLPRAGEQAGVALDERDRLLGLAAEAGDLDSAQGVTVFDDRGRFLVGVGVMDVGVEVVVVHGCE